LLWLLENHGEALEADLRRFYQVRLVDMYRGEISPREVSVYATNLPRASAVGVRLGGAAAITGEVEASWLLENVMMRIAHSQAGGKGKVPEMRDYPLGVAEQAEKENFAVSRAEAFRRKHLNK
jgi:hypothetical protein